MPASISTLPVLVTNTFTITLEVVSSLSLFHRRLDIENFFRLHHKEWWDQGLILSDFGQCTTFPTIEIAPGGSGSNGPMMACRKLGKAEVVACGTDTG